MKTQDLDSAAQDISEQTTTELLNTYSEDEYIRKIQKRLEEDTFAREQREKRRRKMLMEQLIAHEAQEVRYLCCALRRVINLKGNNKAKHCALVVPLTADFSYQNIFRTAGRFELLAVDKMDNIILVSHFFL